ncbi:YpiF family protein [Anoxybacillus rupiensis]|uniref:YpiF family protein n=1 Tax=Anoxybacteroides rupiense TaxID=311460 RepID=A0ABD5IVF7_9BACL|nr:YpiF family protein [Anoxybacillus rupiensis]
MKWTVSDIDMYEKEKQYIDTALLPLIQLTLSNATKTAVAGGELVQLLASEVERQLKGRLFLLPPFTYFLTETKEECVKRLNVWTDELKKSGMAHVFYLTSDRMWNETELGGKLFVLPSIPLEHMDEVYQQQMVREQTSKLLSSFISHWT